MTPPVSTDDRYGSLLPVPIPTPRSAPMDANGRKKAERRAVPPRPGDMPRLRELAFIPERAIEVAGKIHAMYDTRSGFFANKEFALAPEHAMVQGIENPDVVADMIFLAVVSDRITVSSNHYPRFRRTYEQDPALVRIGTIAELSESQAQAHFRERFGMGAWGTVGKDLYRAAQHIAQKYGANPVNMLRDLPSVHDARARLDEELPGVDRQVAKLLLKNVTELGLYKWKDDWQLPPKVDIWNQVIAVATDTVMRTQGEGLEPIRTRVSCHSLVQVLDRGYEALCREGRVDGRALNNQLWALGARGCAQASRMSCHTNCDLYRSGICSVLPASYHTRDGTLDAGADRRGPFEQYLFAGMDL